MGKTFAQIALRRQTVYEFSSRVVAKGIVLRILNLARWAPSAHNDQNWRFVVVRDRSVIAEIFEHCLYGSFYSPPPVLIAIVAKPIYEKKPGLNVAGMRAMNEYHRYINIGFVGAQLVNAAESMGIGSCIVSPTNNRPNEILGIETGAHVPILIGLGYPAKKVFRKKRERKTLTELVSYEKYRRKQ